MELGRQLFAGALSQCLFEKLARFATFAAVEALGLDGRLAIGGNGDFNALVQAAPPTLTVSLIEPSACDFSVTVCPCLRASSFAFSTAYDCRKRSR